MGVRSELEKIEREERIKELVRFQKVLSSYLSGEDIMNKRFKRNINNDNDVLYFNGKTSSYYMPPKKIPINVKELPMECEVLATYGDTYAVLRFNVVDNSIFFYGQWFTIKQLVASGILWSKKGSKDWNPFTKEVEA